jgi:selenocysteine-specific elongation factor
MSEPAPLTVGTAGHIDHGKTALVRALTGIDTARLPEEKTRGMTIVLGFAPLRLGDGRVLSLVDVPGHERLIRMMVSGATGIDLFLLVIAADDGVMPQTLEHIRIIEALGVERGVVAVTKSDLAEPAPAAAAAAALLPHAEVVPCSSRTGAGVAEVAHALGRVAAGAPPRSADGAVTLHIDRAFTINGAGTVVTGTLWSGRIRRGDRLALLPAERSVRARGVHVHDRPVDQAAAGQRVALNLAGVERRAVARGDVLVSPGARIAVTHRIELMLAIDEPLRDHERVQVLHGTRATAARAVPLDRALWQMRMEQPLLAADGDRVVVRRISPPATLGGGVIVTAAAVGRRHAGRAAGGVTGGAPAPPIPAPPTPAPSTPSPTPAPPTPSRATPGLDPGALALEQRLRLAGHEPPTEAELGDEARHLGVLRAAGRAVRIGRTMHAHPEAIASVGDVVEHVVRARGSITLAGLRDELGTSRKYAQALLEHLDAARFTRRRQDDSRVLRGPGTAPPR